MFEKWFGVNNKKENNPSVEGVAHIDGSFEDSRLPNNSQEVQDGIDFIDDNNKKKYLGERWDIQERKDLSVFSKNNNERRHPKLGEKHSDWKEKEQSSPIDSTIYGKVEDPDLAELMQDEEDKKSIREFYNDEDDYEGGNFEKAA